MRKKVVIGILSILLFSVLLLTSFAFAGNGCNPPIQLPSSEIQMNLVSLGPNSYFSTTLSGIPPGDYDVENGVSYDGHCADPETHIGTGDFEVMLYSSYDLSMPSHCLKNGQWDRINYIINNKNGYGLWQIQYAINYQLGFRPDSSGTFPPYNQGPGINDDGWELIQNANQSGDGYCPSPGQKIAVIADAGANYQVTFFELTVPEHTCQEEVWIDDNFNYATPGFGITHFNSKQQALEWLGPDGIAHMYEGIYNEDIIVDSVPCDNTGMTQYGEYGCFPLSASAFIKGSETIFVDDVTIKYLEYTPNTDGSIIVRNGVSDTTLRCNKFRQDCNPHAVGVRSYSSSMVNAELNWWGRPTGPNGGKMDDGAIADGLGVHVIGNVDVEPWIGIHAEITDPVWSMGSESIVEVNVGEPVLFDASESWAYTYGECCQEPKKLHLQYLWDFDDNSLSSNKIAYHIFKEPGVYEVSLMVDSDGIPGLYSNFMYDWANVTVRVIQVEEPLTAHINSDNLDTINIPLQESFTFNGTAEGGSYPYTYTWDFGDETVITQQSLTYTFDTPGLYKVNFTVIDAKNAQASDTILVNVSEEQKTDEDHKIGEIEITVSKWKYLHLATITSEEQVNWSIDMKGKVLFGGHAEGVTIGKTDLFFPFSLGFGNVDIVIKAGTDQKDFNAFMIGPILLNLHQG